MSDRKVVNFLLDLQFQEDLRRAKNLSYLADKLATCPEYSRPVAAGTVIQIPLAKSRYE